MNLWEEKTDAPITDSNFHQPKIQKLTGWGDHADKAEAESLGVALLLLWLPGGALQAVKGWGLLAPNKSRVLLPYHCSI